MIQTTLRPFSVEERNYLLEQIRHQVTVAPNHYLKFLRGFTEVWNWFLYASLGGLIYLLSNNIGVAAWTGVIAAVIGRIAFYLCEPVTPSQINHRVALLLNQLQHDQIEETTVVASGVVAVRDTLEDTADYLQGYFFDIGGNEVLFLHDDYFPVDDSIGTVSLPSVFTIVRYPNGDLINITPAGPNLTVSRTLCFVDEDTILSLEDGEIFPNASLETLEQDLPELFYTSPTG